MSSIVSLKDIAKKVGVSVPLVSYVLGGKAKKNRVSEETAKKIREVAKELNYRPNLNARSLKTKRTRTIGVILADISNPFFSNLARIIEDEAFKNDYTVIFGSSDENAKKFDRILDNLLTRQVDGLIIAPPKGSKETILALQKQSIPFVLIDRYFKQSNYNYVVTDNVNASFLATNYLLKKGHKHIATIGYDSDLAHYNDRYEGYYTALKEINIEPNNHLVHRVEHPFQKNKMSAIISQLITDGTVRAIFFQTNTLAEEGLHQLMTRDREILQKIDVVVFDQNSAYHFLENFVPYIKQPIKEMGQKALKILIDTIENPSAQPVQIQLKGNLKSKR